MIEVGTYLKVRIPHREELGTVAECPWAQVIGMTPSRRIIARIDNELICSDLHGYWLGDHVELEEVWFDGSSAPVWQVAGPSLPVSEHEIDESE